MNPLSFFTEPFGIWNDPFFSSFSLNKPQPTWRQSGPLPTPARSDRYKQPQTAVVVVKPRPFNGNRSQFNIGNQGASFFGPRASHRDHGNKKSNTSGRKLRRDPEILPTSTSLGNKASYELRYAKATAKTSKTSTGGQRISSHDMGDDGSTKEEQSSKESSRVTPTHENKKRVKLKKTSYSSKTETETPKQGFDPNLTALIENDIVQVDSEVTWNNIAGLDDVKQMFKETFLLPKLMPQLFKGVLRPWRGILLFGPPGTGKTLLARAVASQMSSTFFHILPSTLTSKHYGESEKLVRTLFTMAKTRAPSVVFLDEIDAFCQRQRSGHEATRRVRCEMLTHMDGVVSGGDKDRQVVVLAATNHPWDLDEALKRRFEKRIYIPLPDEATRKQIVELSTAGIPRDETVDMSNVSKSLAGYSGSDIRNVCQEAVLMAARELMQTVPSDELATLEQNQIVLTADHFMKAKEKCKKSVNGEMIKMFKRWNNLYGSR